MTSFDWKDCFDCEDFSDITIRASGRDIKLHRLVLDRHSEYFKAMLRPKNGFAENKQGIVELKDDEPEAALGMLKWLYGFDYTDIAAQMRTPAGKKHLDLFVVGKKYLHPDLSKAALDILGISLGKVEPTALKNVTTLTEQFELFKAIYEHHAEDSRLSEMMCKIRTRMFPVLMQLQDFRQWLEGEDEMRFYLCSYFERASIENRAQEKVMRSEFINSLELYCTGCNYVLREEDDNYCLRCCG